MSLSRESTNAKSAFEVVSPVPSSSFFLRGEYAFSGFFCFDLSVSTRILHTSFIIAERLPNESSNINLNGR
ncbi:hypothetical protein NY2A_b362L [Paramecium bursaria Chlorella virus NY2A]|uniref:Uncharacterized protein b362L n=1 Tax=Paramecium bursaria Chlorella virus NY2A TaxID=46021 RepID=A7IWN7_PBCVN|nr:hypothetical protein NY2A_b362L [Paramecium bursaria Chlorella virus NY2A]ABT14761.1 hypothetical protein NY2A_b362L [Paramecium bursaria Chlorella virus NY2A]